MPLYQKYTSSKARQSLLSNPDKRIVVNKKFSYLVAKGDLLKKFTPEEVFNYYTGKGGLHGLKRSDYSSFHDYTEAKKEIEQGAFFTPDSFFEKIHKMIGVDSTHFVADLSFGKGGFFNYCPNETNVYGCELDPLSANIGIGLFNKGNLQQGDLRLYTTDVKQDIIFGNPPFNLRWTWKNERSILSQMVYMYKAKELLKEGGLLVMLVPQSFLADSFYDSGARESIDANFRLIAQTKLDKSLFKEAGVEAFDTKLMFFEARDSEVKSTINALKGKDGAAILAKGKPEKRVNDYELFLEIDDEVAFQRDFIQPVLQNLKKASSKLLNSNKATHEGFPYKVKKLLYDIKRHTATNPYHAKCLAYYNKFATQSCPQDMKYDEWVKKHKISEKMVINYLRSYLMKRNPKKSHKKGDIIKNDYEIVTYTSAVSKQKHSINDVIYYNQMHLPEVQPFLRLMRKKRRFFDKQTQSFDTMKLDPKIQKFLKSVSLVNDDLKPVYLNKIQLQDTNRVLQKNFAYNQWDMGTGKTLTGMAQIKYRLKMKQVEKVCIIGPAIAIDGTWDAALQKNGIRAINVKCLADLEKGFAEDYDVVMLSHYFLGKYQRRLKKLVRLHKIFLLVDEADEYSSPTATRTKNALSVFRRVAYKTLMSGTSVRNNIPEFYAQLELLYNNTILMTDACAYHYSINNKPKVAEIGAVLQKRNLNVHKPFPAYRGFRLFKTAFNPSKATVFGVQKQDQKIFNHEVLAGLIDYTVITRSFEDITGRSIHTIHQELIDANEQEIALEKEVKEGISKFYGRYISSTGNSRKDAMLRLIQQMKLLFKACAIPTSFDEYTLDTSSKYEKVKTYLDSTREYVAIGGIHKQEMKLYKEWIERDYPEKKIFYIDGDISIKKRQAMIRELKEVPNSVLISTIGALKSSLNINFIDKILVVSLPWNFSSLDQFQKRFVRYDSENFKHIHYITLRGTIESNLIKMIIDKDSLVSFMKTKKLDSSTQLNIDIGMIMSMIVDRKELLNKSEEDKAA